MLHKFLSPLGINAATAYAASFLSVFLSIVVWIGYKQDDRGASERLAIFVGLWAPTLMALGNSLEKSSDSPTRT